MEKFGRCKKKTKKIGKSEIKPAIPQIPQKSVHFFCRIKKKAKKKSREKNQELKILKIMKKTSKNFANNKNRQKNEDYFKRTKKRKGFKKDPKKGYLK